MAGTKSDHDEVGRPRESITEATCSCDVDQWLAISSEGPRDDLHAAMSPLEAKKALLAYVAGIR